MAPTGEERGTKSWPDIDRRRSVSYLVTVRRSLKNADGVHLQKLGEKERDNNIVDDAERGGAHPGLDWHVSICHSQLPLRSSLQDVLAKVSRRTSNLPENALILHHRSRNQYRLTGQTVYVLISSHMTRSKTRSSPNVGKV